MGCESSDSLAQKSNGLSKSSNSSSSNLDAVFQALMVVLTSNHLSETSDRMRICEVYNFGLSKNLRTMHIAL